MKNTTLCYIEKDEKYLMLHRIRKENDENRDKWIGIGGKFEAGESPEDCMRREIFEETGLTAKSMELLGVFSGPDMHFVYPNGDEVSNVDIVYICRDFDGIPAPQEGEVTELRYFHENEITDDMISPPNLRALLTFFEKEKQK